MPIDHTKNIIEVQDVSFAYNGSPVLQNINLNIHQGDYLGIVGPNGGGKSTLLKLMLGLLTPSSGEIKLFGVTCKNFHEWSKLGYVPQKAINFDQLFPATVYEVVAMGRYGKRGLLRRLNHNDTAIIENSLHQVEMIQYKDRLIGDLSSGQQQRVFIARALAGEPEVILLDEPTTGVDAKTQKQFYGLLKKLNQELNITLITVSHDLEVIAAEATELACINQTLVYHGEPREFTKNDYVEKLYEQNVKLIHHDH